jgi:hypothetical protein
MPQVYLHFFGNESNESLLEAYGIVTKGYHLSDALRPKQCPNCNEPNKPDSKFCAKCRMVLTYEAYSETIEEKHNKDTEVENLKEEMLSMKEGQKEIMALKRARQAIGSIERKLDSLTGTFSLPRLYWLPPRLGICSKSHPGSFLLPAQH